MQNAIIDPLVMAPANAQTNTAAIGCVDPSTAPKRPAIMANAIFKSKNVYKSNEQKHLQKCD